jgi:hypothetical protein
MQYTAMETSSFLPELPAHHYGVHVANDMDARRLLYLVEQIGAEKIVKSATNYTQKYPGTRIFVSTLLKRYRIKVPVRIFAPVNIPLYRVYLLLHAASSKLKIGFSSDWLNRAVRFKCQFDLDLSVGIDFGSDKAGAMAAEKMAKTTFQWARTKPPPVPFGAGGRTEWFKAIIFDDAATAIATFNTQHKRNVLTLSKALAHDLCRDQQWDEESATLQ